MKGLDKKGLFVGIVTYNLTEEKGAMKATVSKGRWPFLFCRR